MKNPRILFPLLVLLLLAAWFAGRLSAPSAGSSEPTGSTEAATEYTCSMHPQVRQPKPGECPICAMDLIPAGQLDKRAGGERELVLTEHAKALARIETTPVERRIPEAEIRLFGRVAMDETRMRSITARFPARIERLYVNFTGVKVSEGDHLAKIYSPDLLTAQSELLSAIRFNDQRAIQAAREKLALWGLKQSAIDAIVKRGEPSDTMDIDSPMGGFVTKKMVNEGDYLETGSVLFEIADLSTVWVMLDAYEMDKPWLRFGQPVTFTAEALPGQTFEGRINFIPPVLDEKTRAFKVRVTVPNESLTLRPGMFVTGAVHASVAGEGLVLDSSFEGKWISPMHPEIVKDAPGECDVCGMDLVPAAELGYVASTDTEAPLLVPASSVLQTGKRAIVYVEVEGRDAPVYEGREIVLGPRAEDHYLVVSGLKEGEEVVTHGAFKIDSALQLLAKPSMMSAEPDTPPTVDAPPAMRSALGELTQAYFPIWQALANDDLESARSAATKLEGAVHQFHGIEANEAASHLFETTLGGLATAATGIAEAEEIEPARNAFEQLSSILISAVRAIGLPDTMEVHRAFCPMTFEGRRSDWLQPDEALLNPYFGARMLRCGDFEPLTADAAPEVTPAPAPAGHQH